MGSGRQPGAVRAGIAPRSSTRGGSLTEHATIVGGTRSSNGVIVPADANSVCFVPLAFRAQGSCFSRSLPVTSTAAAQAPFWTDRPPSATTSSQGNSCLGFDVTNNLNTAVSFDFEGMETWLNTPSECGRMTDNVTLADPARERFHCDVVVPASQTVQPTMDISATTNMGPPNSNNEPLPPGTSYVPWHELLVTFTVAT